MEGGEEVCVSGRGEEVCVSGRGEEVCEWKGGRKCV